MRMIASVCLVLLTLAVPSSLFAVDVGEWMKINGFLSQGFLISDGNNFLGKTEEGSFQINEVGLTLNSQVTDKLRLGVQLLSRDLGDEGNNDIRLDWGLADYRFHDLLGIRLGKVKRPMGLYNEERDSDFLRPMAFLPQSIYDETRRDLLIAYQGIGLYGNIPAGPAGDIDYQLFKGEFNFPDKTTISEVIKLNAQELVAKNKQKPAAQRNSAIPDQVGELKMKNRYVEGAQLILNTSVDGLRVGVSYLRGKQDLFINGTQQGKLDIKSRVIYSLEYCLAGATLASEYSETDREQVLFNVTTIKGRTQEWYVMLTYALTDSLSLSVLYDEYYNDKHDKDGNNFVKQGKPAYLGWRKDFGSGFRYDINPNWTVKGEWHYVDGAGLGLQVFNPQGVQRYWQYGVMKASFNF